MALREIRKKGDPLLKKPSREVGEIDGRVRQLLEDMEETLRQVGGAGIAAPQVGVLRRLVVILPWEESGLEQPLFLVNPRLVGKDHSPSAGAGRGARPGGNPHLHRGGGGAGQVSLP